MQRPHPSFGRCLSLSCLGVADAVARGCLAVVVAEVAACMVEAAASRVLHHALLHKGKALFVLVPNLPFSADTHPQVWPSAAQIHTGIPRCRSPSPEGGVFLVQPFWLILSIYGSRGSSRSPGQQLRLPHRSRRQNEVPVVRWRGLSTYPNRHGTCLSVIPYGRHARCGSLWCPFPAVVRPSWSTPRTRLLCEKWALCTLSYKKNAYLCKDIGGGSAISSKT